MDTQGLTYRMACYSRLIWLRMEIVERLGAEHSYAKYLRRLLERYVD
jgi:hypothetical protein